MGKYYTEADVDNLKRSCGVNSKAFQCAVIGVTEEMTKRESEILYEDFSPAERLNDYIVYKLRNVDDSLARQNEMDLRDALSRCSIDLANANKCTVFEAFDKLTEQLGFEQELVPYEVTTDYRLPDSMMQHVENGGSLWVVEERPDMGADGMVFISTSVEYNGSICTYIPADRVERVEQAFANAVSDISVTNEQVEL